MNQKIKIVTHNGGFHADDIFGVAALLLHLGKEKSEVEIIRTRDPKSFVDADYLIDIGMRHSPDEGRFDHHQKGGAGKRENGIPYAAFGLVWKEFGAQIAGSQEAADKIDKRLVQSVDAQDVGFSAWKSVVPGFFPYTIQSVFLSFSPGPEGDASEDDAAFYRLLDLARQILSNEIAKANWEVRAVEKIIDAYEKAEDKRLVVLEGVRGWDRSFIGMVLSRFPEPLYFIRQHNTGDWQVVSIEKEMFVSRKPMPEDWRGKVDGEVADATGVSDAVFCHLSGFMCVTKTKKGAQQLAELALEK